MINNNENWNFNYWFTLLLIRRQQWICVYMVALLQPAVSPIKQPQCVFPWLKLRQCNFYARQHTCYSVHMPWQFRPSVTRVDQSKTVEARITQFSPYSSPIPLVFRGKFHPEILRGSPWAGASKQGGVGKTSEFRASSVKISTMVQDTTKVTIDH